ncbi:lithostathine-1-beta-like [Pecten maximus]|uniref:lithostathine-1-beta-like n=1 Tax=Pecten maximus TaxID=6579 RepID=UPI001458127E|nr:lithostathine-1-beta-like [Pecten maximus]
MQVLCKAATFLLATIILLTGGAESSLSSCPSSLTRNNYLKEYKEYCLQFVHGEKTWDDARADCNKHGGDLVQVVDQDFQNFVVTTLRDVLNWDRHGVWIGATDHDVEKKWMWVTGQELTWSFWQPGEGPHHTGGFLFVPSNEAEDCAQIRLDDALGRWHDYRCSGLGIHYSYICQYYKVDTNSQAPTVPRMTTEAVKPPHPVSTTGIDGSTGQQNIHTADYFNTMETTANSGLYISTEHYVDSDTTSIQYDEKSED